MRDDDGIDDDDLPPGCLGCLGCLVYPVMLLFVVFVLTWISVLL